MAAQGSVNNQQSSVESVVNRWIVDYYVFRALESFKNDDYADFCSIRDVLEGDYHTDSRSVAACPPNLLVMDFV